MTEIFWKKDFCVCLCWSLDTKLCSLCNVHYGNVGYFLFNYYSILELSL